MDITRQNQMELPPVVTTEFADAVPDASPATREKLNEFGECGECVSNCCDLISSLVSLCAN